MGAAISPGREAGGSNLVEQRLKGVVVLAVNDRDLDRKAGDLAGGGQAPETSPDDDDSRSRLSIMAFYYRDSQNGDSDEKLLMLSFRRN